ncbi:hypothetical protein [Streptomyces sp. NPDC102462]|uniref:hypothetical protein n=1 Tax=Streptomyces sp. NPDC102462 TaxID=3366178 RepID=UPI0038168ECE
MLSAPRRRIRRDLAHLADDRCSGVWIRSLAEANSATMHALGAALRTYFAPALRPYGSRVRAAFEAIAPCARPGRVRGRAAVVGRAGDQAARLSRGRGG